MRREVILWTVLAAIAVSGCEEAPCRDGCGRGVPDLDLGGVERWEDVDLETFLEVTREYRFICAPSRGRECPSERKVEAERGDGSVRTVLERATGFSSLWEFDDGRVLAYYIWDVGCGPVEREGDCCYAGLISYERIENAD